MNLDELDNPASASESDQSVRGYRQSSKEALRLPSAPLDPEWVSPFTLPPLPALRKKRDRSRLLQSPQEHLHQRSNSSAYYAAAWGSPYATPSPNRSPAPRLLQRRSQDWETSSPLSQRVKDLEPGKYDTKPPALDLSSAASPPLVPVRERASSWDKSLSLSERFNWLSESELSSSEADLNAGKTPTRATYLKSLGAGAEGELGIGPRSRSHQVQDSVATITPETFNAVSNTLTLDKVGIVSQATMEPAPIETPEVPAQHESVDKPLPNLPSTGSTEAEVKTTQTTSVPESPSRPRMTSIQSWQRPKRKVPWKGKTCIIALPLTDREIAGLPTLLTSEELEARMQKWIADGFEVNQLRHGGPQDTSSGFGQSRPLYPDPQDMLVERKAGKLQVHMPDQDEWDAWVEYLKEEKLRALGVTPSNSEPPMSVQSPFSSTLSRVSSTYPSVTASPPIGTLSLNGNQLRIAGNTFSPPLGPPGALGSRHGSHVTSPSISGFPAPLHAYKQSMSFPRMTSPYDYPISHPGSLGAINRHNVSGTNSRHMSPSAVGNLQSLGQVLSPGIPVIPSNDGTRGAVQNPTMEQIRQQQQRQQHLHQQMLQHQRQQSYFPPPQPRSADQLPQTLPFESPPRKTPEIMHPTPRSHRHNLSAALQRGVDDDEARKVESRLTKGPAAVEENENQSTVDKLAAVGIDEENEAELPVLKRPETLPDEGEQSEIDTNPSIDASPKLTDNSNPFASPLTNLQQVKDSIQTQSQHKTQPSMSKLNVKAPEFNPQSTFSNSAFSFGISSFQPAIKSSQMLPAGAKPSFSGQNLSISKLNIDAPAFTPSFIQNSTPAKQQTLLQDTPARSSAINSPSLPFTFSSPIFNVDAPEFKPSHSLSRSNLSVSHVPIIPAVESIFGIVSIDPNTRVNRRGQRVFPVLQSKQDNSEEPSPDDKDGRPIAPAERLKRVRRIDADNEEELLFASSAPFDTSEGLSHHSEALAPTEIADLKSEDHEVNEGEIAQEANRPASGKSDGVQSTQSPAQASAALSDDNKDSADLPNTGFRSQDLPTNSVSSPVVESVQIQEPQITDPPSDHEIEPRIIDVEPIEDEVIEVIEVSPILADKIQEDDEESSSIVGTIPRDHKPAFSLSALAKPFEFTPKPLASDPEPTTSSQRKDPERDTAQGPMASRSVSSSPALGSPGPAELETSPSQELYEYIVSDDAIIENLASPTRSYTKSPPLSHMSSQHFETTPHLVKSIEESMRREAQIKALSRSPSQESRVEEAAPSFEEIDAVMKQFQNDPNLGVERDDTPIKSTPSIDMRLAPIFRSDAPSPSPSRRGLAPQRRAEWGLGIHKLNDGNEQISDWNDEFSPRQIDKLQNQTHYFDARVNNLVDGALGNRLGPMEQALHSIEASLVHMVDKTSQDRTQRSASTERRESSDADDEDDLGTANGFSTYRSRSPGRSQRRNDRLKALVADVLGAQRSYMAEQNTAETISVRAVLEEMRSFTDQMRRDHLPSSPKMRTVMEDVITNHSHFSTLRKQDEIDDIRETYKLRLETLESSFRQAEIRADEAVSLRKQADDELKQAQKELLDVREDAALQRHAFMEIQCELDILKKEHDSLILLQSKQADLVENNAALENTLAEYRITSNQFREDIRLERARNEDLIWRMRNLREEFNEKSESRQVLRSQLERLQGRMTEVMNDVHAEESLWREKEHELVLQNKTIQAALDHEMKHRGRVESELQDLVQEHKQTVGYRVQHEQDMREIVQLQEQVATLSKEGKTHEIQSSVFERELASIKEVQNTSIIEATASLQSELEAEKAARKVQQAEWDDQMARIQKSLDDAEFSLKEQKVRHESVHSGLLENHAKALHEANQKQETIANEMRLLHERDMSDLKERHSRELHNSIDDRQRLEDSLTAKLGISEDRIKHLEGQVRDLEERLEITKSAARAAVEAATAKGADIPTPAASVIASPPHRMSSASVQLVKGTDLPEKISPQAMRESIMVLQDQLQNREQTIEQLEANLAAVDRDAPSKLKDRDNEIVLLRELLGVRVDDLNEIITTLLQPNFDRVSAKNAAIRLKANLQMEQQLKERAAAISNIKNSLPSLSSISNMAPSPRGLPMAAAAAFGNWKKARDYSLNAVSDIAANISQTPSRSSTVSPSSVLSGIVTPPNTLQRTNVHAGGSSISPSLRPLASSTSKRHAGAPPEARPLRTISSQPRTLSSRQNEARRESVESSSSEMSKRQLQFRPETPTTPLAGKSANTLDLGDDVDEDASPLDTNVQNHYGYDKSRQETLT